MTITRRMLGSPGDWQIRRPRLPSPAPGLSWLGPITVIASVALSWLAFADAIGEEGEGSPSFGLFIGAASILLMAWSFLLALRPRTLEPLFGGLDSMYRVHRWAGTLAVIAMFLHTRMEPEIEDGFRGASKQTAEFAEELAGVAEIALYVLIGISLIRWFPYRWWRLTHKLLGVPFLFACLHFYTAEKPYPNGSGWGWYFGIFMVVGIVAYGLRVVVRDMIFPGLRYTISGTTVHGTTLELTLRPDGDRLQHQSGQFAVVKVQKPGLSEPHIFTIASGPDEPALRFFIRDLGDWTTKMQTADLLGATVVVEGPYGRFEPTLSHTSRTVWVAGGVGITPFLSASHTLDPAPEGERPVLFYAVRSVDDAMALDVLRQAEAEGRIDLRLCSSSLGTRFSRELLAEHVGSDLSGAHVAVCGPVGLIRAASDAARSLGATHIETEDFDIRQGFGPDLSQDVDNLITQFMAGRTDRRR
jgi:predicted ferric reductase